jgi:hypothetical protein
MIPVDSQITITIAGIDFDYHDYDERGDVLYLHVGAPEVPPAHGPARRRCSAPCAAVPGT